MTPLSILYIDDDADIRVIVGMALALDRAIALRCAAGGEEALALIASGYVPDVAVLDVMMPGLDGPALLDRFRAIGPMRAVPVIFMTAKARNADLAMYRARGAAGVIVKPFDPIGLAGEIRSILARSRGSDDHAAGEHD